MAKMAETGSGSGQKPAVYHYWAMTQQSILHLVVNWEIFFTINIHITVLAGILETHHPGYHAWRHIATRSSMKIKTLTNYIFLNEEVTELWFWCKTRNVWQSLAYSQLGTVVSPPTEYLWKTLTYWSPECLTAPSHSEHRWTNRGNNYRLRPYNFFRLKLRSPYSESHQIFISCTKMTDMHRCIIVPCFNCCRPVQITKMPKSYAFCSVSLQSTISFIFARFIYFSRQARTWSPSLLDCYQMAFIRWPIHSSSRNAFIIIIITSIF